MALTPRPSDDFALKSNPNPVVNRRQEATAEDFQEAASHFNWIFDWIAAQSGTTPTRSSVGAFTGITQLTTALPTGQPEDYAIIEQFPGASLQFAVWNEISEEWELQESKELFVFVTNYAARPNPGIENTFYITLDLFNMYLFKNGEYKLLNPPSGVLKLNDTNGHPWSVIKNVQNNNPNSQLIEVNDICEGFTDNTYTRYLKLSPTAIPFNVNDNSTYKRIEEKLFS